MSFNGKEHIVVVGWSRKAKHAIGEIREHDRHRVIVLVASLEKIAL
ncbi:MAG: hypothetical protein ACI35R_08490 [Bacillus sp. (in: firmicutes)]